MAINVNTVYQTVLLILNKEQRGYMTPVEFNKIGTQVQLEIFEKYFEDLNQQLRIPQTNTDYADRVLNLDEKISIFKTNGSASYANNTFNLPTSNGASYTWTITSSGATTYAITNISASDLADGTTTVYVNGLIRPSSDYTISGNTLIWNNNTPRGIVSNTVVGNVVPPNKTITTTTIIPQPDIAVGSYIRGNTVTGSVGNASDTVNILQNGTGFGIGVNQAFITDTAQTLTLGDPIEFINNITVVSQTNNFYRLGTVTYEVGALLPTELQRVDRSEIYHLNASKLTRPSTKYPVYLYENNKLTVYPKTIQSGINVDYIRKPLNPIWDFTSSSSNNYAYVYDSANSVNFELHESEQTEIILKVLLYAGVVVKDPTIIQVAAQQIQQEQINQKS